MLDMFGTLPLQIEQWRLCDSQDSGGSHNKQNYYCIMMAGVELEKDASGPEMSKSRI